MINGLDKSFILWGGVEMRKENVWCDICEEETDSPFAIDIKWCNNNDYKRYDMCHKCVRKAELMDIKGREKERSHDKTLLGLLRMFIKNKIK